MQRMPSQRDGLQDVEMQDPTIDWEDLSFNQQGGSCDASKCCEGDEEPTGSESVSTNNDSTATVSSLEELERNAATAVHQRCCSLLTRYVALWLLSWAAVFVGVHMVRSSSVRQETELEQEFERVSSEVVRLSQARSAAVLETMKTLSLVVSATSSHDGEWPFVTLDGFDLWTSELTGFGIQELTLGVIVHSDELSQWEIYSREHLPRWLEPEIGYAASPYVWPTSMDNTSSLILEDIAAVSWQTAPPSADKVNFNHLSNPSFEQAFDQLHRTMDAVMWFDLSSPNATWVLQPIFKEGHHVENIDEKQLDAFLLAEVPFKTYLQDVPWRDLGGLGLRVSNPCSGDSTTIGWDSHELRMEEFEETDVIEHFAVAFDLQTQDHAGRDCSVVLQLNPTVTHPWSLPQEGGNDISPATLALVVLLYVIFFILYDWYIRTRQAKLSRSLLIVKSLFPATVRGRLLDRNYEAHSRGATDVPDVSTDIQTGSALPVPSGASVPLSELFPHVTVMFGDIVGFTAWSSIREPSQVFNLLESIFDGLDRVARRRGVFKVETIGDCYVAAAGLPEPRQDHAVVMALFASKAAERVRSVVRGMDSSLGPGTAELSMRFGLHSGPVMGGVLRGEKSRFQLFGDTMNTAARIEATGARNKIHASQQTAEYLSIAGKEAWVTPRDNLVTAKGKGQLQTYWVNVRIAVPDNTRISRPASMRVLPGPSRPTLQRRMSLPVFERAISADSDALLSAVDPMERLIDFNTQVLEQFLRRMVAVRDDAVNTMECSFMSLGLADPSAGSNIIDEVSEVLSLPSLPTKYVKDPESVELDEDVLYQLRDYVATIASLYRDVPFHSFDHASHVTMSVTKLFSRIISPETIGSETAGWAHGPDSKNGQSKNAMSFTLDPLTQFSVAFAALIHDVDHPGIPNAQLEKEEIELATKYRFQSIAEQNSFQLGWELLMEPRYEDLCQCMFTSQVEQERFRSMVVNSVMATDIADKKLGDLRRRRWAKVFGTPDTQPELADDRENSNRKATIVIEHLIQASDVAHTMQHWHVYLHWNKRLFEEQYLAYKTGRAEKDPSKFWYQGELGFFDNYIIPLAQKLKECGVFGVSSDEYLNYAMANRKEWELKGKGVVEEYLSEFQAKSATAHAAAACARLSCDAGCPSHDDSDSAEILL